MNTFKYNISTKTEHNLLIFNIDIIENTMLTNFFDKYTLFRQLSVIPSAE